MIEQDRDHFFMQKAIILAKKGEFTARPNPCVGCVLVKNDKIIGEGLHWQAGLAHAEINALQQAMEQAKGATCYVTLEPCAHEGRTGPCVDALIEAGIARVVISSHDPNPLVAGKGVKKLIAAGIEVKTQVLKQQADLLNCGFFSRMQRQKPFVRAKIAMSLDGRVAMASGESQWITGPQARQNGHEWRARSGAIITTAKTVNTDNCRLTVRHLSFMPACPPEVMFEQPLRVIVDTQNCVSSDASIFNEPGDTVVVVSSRVPDLNGDLDYIGLPEEDGHVDLTVLLSWLAEEEINDVLIEAGPTFIGAMLKANLVDELLVYVAPILLGSDAKAMADLPGFSKLSDKIEGSYQCVEQKGTDLFIRVALSEFARAYDNFSN